MQVKPLSTLLGAALLLSACVTAKVITRLAGPIDFKHYKAVKLVMVDEVRTRYSWEAIPIFEAWLKDMIRSQGYSLVDRGEDMKIEVQLTSFQPGGGLSWTFGFRDNAALLTYRASFRDGTGALIAELEGGKTYYGGEGEFMGAIPLWTSEEVMRERVRILMIRHSTIQIGQFIQNNGRLE